MYRSVQLNLTVIINRQVQYTCIVLTLCLKANDLADPSDASSPFYTSQPYIIAGTGLKVRNYSILSTS